MFLTSYSVSVSLLALALSLSCCIDSTLAHNNQNQTQPEESDSELDLLHVHRFGWIPLPGLGQVPKPGTSTGTLSVVDNVALLLINGHRLTNQAPVVTYNTQLRDTAFACAQSYVALNIGHLTLPLPRPACAAIATAGATVGFAGSNNSNGVRQAIADTSTASWFLQYVNNQGSFPPAAVPVYSAAYEDFTQMVWVGTTEVGCAFSGSTVLVTAGANPAFPAFILICLWTPIGNVPATFPANVLADI